MGKEGIEITRSSRGVNANDATDDDNKQSPSARVITNVVEIKGRVLPDTIKLIKDAAIGDLLITDKTLADEVRKGKRDLSLDILRMSLTEPGSSMMSHTRQYRRAWCMITWLW